MRRTCAGSIGRATKSSPNQLGEEIPKVSEMLREIAAPIEPGEKIHPIIERVARRCGIAKWRMFDIWYGKARFVTDEEIEQIATATEVKRREAVRNEARELRLRIERMEARLAQTDADFHRENISALRLALRGRG